MEVSVIGCGRWGSFIAWYLNKIGHKVVLQGRESSENMQQLIAHRTNGLLDFPLQIKLTTDIEEAMKSEIVVISVASQQLRNLMQTPIMANAQNKLFVLCMKGIEIGTGKRLSEVMADTMSPSSRCAVWLGPGHVQEFAKGVPNCMVIDAQNTQDKEMLVDAFGSDLIRFYYGSDLIGNEVGAAAKNVVGIAAGMLDGFGLSSLKGALMSRGTREYARLIVALGGNELSAYGLCHLGDYEATVFSEHSHNRSFGEKFVKGEEHTVLAEGYYTVKALMQLAKKNNVDLPITQAIYKILYEGFPPSEALNSLFSRSIKPEFDQN